MERKIVGYQVIKRGDHLGNAMETATTSTQQGKKLRLKVKDIKHLTA